MRYGHGISLPALPLYAKGKAALRPAHGGTSGRSVTGAVLRLNRPIIAALARRLCSS